MPLAGKERWHWIHVNSFEKAVLRLNEILGSAGADRLVPYVTLIAALRGSDLKFKRIAQSPDVEALSDYIAEIRFGLIFAGLQYDLEFEPLWEKGPDLLISRDGHSAFVEVKRFRPTKLTQESTNKGTNQVIFEQYGNPLKDIAKVRAELLRKFAQVNGRNGIVAFWSDNDELKDLDFAFAVTDVRTDFLNQIQRVPDGFLFAIFGSDWRNVSENQQIYCRALRALAEPFSFWVEELESAMVNDCLRAAINRLGTG